MIQQTMKTKEGKRQQHEIEHIIDGVAGAGGKNWITRGKQINTGQPKITQKGQTCIRLANNY
jgi:hypothetical protein